MRETRREGKEERGREKDGEKDTKFCCRLTRYHTRIVLKILIISTLISDWNQEDQHHRED